MNCPTCGKALSRPRSGQSNDRYWAILREAAEQTGYTAEELHEICKARFNRKTKEVFGVTHEYAGSTAWLDQRDFGLYVDSVELWLAENGITITNNTDENIQSQVDRKEDLRGDLSE